jgi:hypothetical protein
MDKGRLAEWILTLAMEPAKAASVIGDLQETGASRDAGWFWSNVFQTLAATVWNDIKTQPLFVVGLAARGALLLCAFLLSVFYARGFIFGFVRATASHSHLAHHPKEWLWPAMRGISLLATFYVGRWTARRSLGRVIFACAAMAMVYPFVYYGFTVLWKEWPSLLTHRELTMPPFWNFWYHWREAGFYLAFLVGALLVRRRWQIARAA